jgi:hypothetical protein
MLKGDKKLGERIRLVVSGLFLATETVFYTLFLVRDLSGAGNTTAIKFAAILTVFVYTLINAGQTDGLIVAVALLFTVLSDTFLLVLNDHYLLGVTAFCVVQMLYFVRMIRLERYRRWWISAAVRMAIWSAALSILGLMGMLDSLLCVTAFYFINLAVNAVESFALCRERKAMLIFSLGLILFVCCDICVGFNNLAAYLPVDGLEGVLKFAAVGMWAFYLPSQVMISLSGNFDRRKQGEG